MKWKVVGVVEDALMRVDESAVLLLHHPAVVGLRSNRGKFAARGTSRPSRWHA